MTNGILLDVPAALRTERLDLRLPLPGQGEVMNAAVLASIEEVGRWMPWARPAPTMEQTETWIRQANARYQLREELPYAIYVRESGELIGGISIFDIRYSVPRGEIGYWMKTSATGNGYMTEAVGAVVRMGFEILQAERLEIRLIAGNGRSARVAERAGFRLEGVLRNFVRNNDGELCDYKVYGLLKEEYLLKK